MTPELTGMSLRLCIRCALGSRGDLCVLSQRRLVEAALSQTVQRQTSSWLAEQRHLAQERGVSAAPDPAGGAAVGMLGEQLRAAASPLRSWRPDYVPMMEAMQQRAMQQAQQAIAQEQAVQRLGTSSVARTVHQFMIGSD
jgi:hypothetical protein